MANVIKFVSKSKKPYRIDDYVSYRGREWIVAACHNNGDMLQCEMVDNSSILIFVNTNAVERV